MSDLGDDPDDPAVTCMCTSLLLKHSPSILEPHRRGSFGCWYSPAKIKVRLVERLTKAYCEAPGSEGTVWRRALEIVDRAFEGV